MHGLHVLAELQRWLGMQPEVYLIVFVLFFKTPVQVF